jgi:WD40 repeat protein
MLALTAAGIIGSIFLPVGITAEKTMPGNKTRVDLYGDPLPSGALMRLGTHRFRHQNRTEAVAYSPDGKTIASAGRDRAVLIWDVSTGKLLHRLIGHTHSIKSLAFSRDGKMLVSSSRMNGQVVLWDPIDGTRIREFPGKFSVPWVAFSPDDRALALVCETGVRILNPKTGAVRGNIKERDVYWAAFTADGRGILTARRRNRTNSSVRLWKLTTGKEIRSFERPKISSVALSADGRVLAAGNQDGSIRVWDVESGKTVRELPSIDTDPGWNGYLAFSPDSKLLATVGDSDMGRAIRILSLENGKEVTRCSGHRNGSSSIAFSADGAKVVSGGFRGRVIVWDPKTGKETVRIISHLSDVRSVRFLPDGYSVVTKSLDGTVRLWDGFTGNALSTLRAHWRWGVSPDGRLMAMLGADGFVHLLDMQTGKTVPMLGGRTSFAEQFAFSQDSKMLASVDEKGVLRVWNVNEGKQIVEFSSRVKVGPIVFSPDGKTLASGAAAVLAREFTDDNVDIDHFPIRLWDPATGKKLLEFGDGKDPVCGLAFSPDGRVLVSGHGVMEKVPRYVRGKRIPPPKSSNTIRFWNLKTGKQIMSLKGHAEAVSSIAFSPDGTLLASGSMDGAIRLWEVAGGKERRKLEGHGVPGLKGIEEAGVFSVAFSPGGRFLVSGSQDGTALVWDVDEVAGLQKPMEKSGLGKSVQPGGQKKDMEAKPTEGK